VRRMARGPGTILVTPRSLTRQRLDRIPELEPLRAAGFSMVAAEPGRTPTTPELLRLLPGVVGWLAGVEPITREVLQSAEDLVVISRNGTGVDAIDLDAAEELGIAVLRARGANAQGVAELALTLALTCIRGVPWASASVKSGGWERGEATEMAELRVGVVGLGAIGRKVADLFAALGSAVAGFDPFVSVPEYSVPGLEEALRSADAVSLHVPGTPDGRPLITADLLRLLRPGAVLVNTARASIVDEEAVLAALDSGSLGAYAVDAFASEPPEPTPLLRHPRVVATPHIGGYTRESVRRATSYAVANLLEALHASRKDR